MYCTYYTGYNNYVLKSVLGSKYHCLSTALQDVCMCKMLQYNMYGEISHSDNQTNSLDSYLGSGLHVQTMSIKPFELARHNGSKHLLHRHNGSKHLLHRHNGSKHLLHRHNGSKHLLHRHNGSKHLLHCHNGSNHLHNNYV